MTMPALTRIDPVLVIALGLLAACSLPSPDLITTASSSAASDVSPAGASAGTAGAAAPPEPTPAAPSVNSWPADPTGSGDPFAASDALIQSIIALPDITQPALEAVLGVALLHDVNYPPESLRYTARIEHGPFESAQVNLPNPQLAEPRSLTAVLLNVRAGVDIQLQKYKEAAIIVAAADPNAGPPPSEPFVTYRVGYLPQHQVSYQFASDSGQLVSALVEYTY